MRLDAIVLLRRVARRYRSLFAKFARLAGISIPIVRRDEGFEDGAFREYVGLWFDTESYLRSNPDVAVHGVDPVEHWLKHGINERRTGSGLIVRRGHAAHQSDIGWDTFTWRGKPIAVRKSPQPLSKRVLDQILQQARHDPAVLAPGMRALPYLRQFEATDLLERDGMDVPALIAGVPERPQLVVLMTALTIGGAEKYAADVVDVFTSTSRSVLVVVTEQTAEQAEGWQQRSILSPILKVPIVFWPDVCTNQIPHTVMFIARFLNMLRPPSILVVNSRLGLEATSRFGRGLSQFARIYCAYFSMSTGALGAPYGARFPRSTLPFALALTDNQPMAETLRRLYGEIPGPGIAVLRPRLVPAPDPVFCSRLESRRKRIASALPPRNWVWISRVELFKGTELLRALALSRPDDRFYVFGPVDGSFESLGLAIPNIIACGNLSDVAEGEFAEHDGFVFTSLFEGMPNIVLDMTQHAIPMVLAEVGGLRCTFDDSAAMFVHHRCAAEDTAAAFSKALDKLLNMTPEQVVSMVTNARMQACAHHSPAQYANAVADLFFYR